MRELVELIWEKQRGGARLLVTLDGPCASGKTTLAAKLGGALPAAVAHTDDFVIPHAMKTPERLKVPGGNCDAERLAEEIVIPWKQGRSVSYRAYDCMTDRLRGPAVLPEADVLILEGCYANLPVIRAHADICAFLDAPWETRLARLQARESTDSLRRFFDLWIPLENAYFDAYHLPDARCVSVSP